MRKVRFVSAMRLEGDTPTVYARVRLFRIVAFICRGSSGGRCEVLVLGAIVSVAQNECGVPIFPLPNFCAFLGSRIFSLSLKGCLFPL